MELKSRKANNYWLLFIINILGLVLYLLMFSPFLSIDDLVAANKIYGCYGNVYDYHHPTISWTYLYVIKCMLEIFPNVPWYTVFLQVIFFVSIFTLTIQISKKFGMKYGVAISCLILLFYGYEGYVAIKYTKTAIFLATVGTYLAVDYKESFGSRIWGLFLLIIGGLIRNNVLMPAFAFGFFYMFASVLGKVKRNGIDRTSTKRFLFDIFIIILIFRGIYLFVNHSDEIFFSNENQYEEWVESEELDWRRSYVQDTRVTVSDKTLETYKKHGITENDIYIWQNWNYDWNTVSDDVIKCFEKFNTAFGKKEIMNVSGQTVQRYLKVFPLSYLKVDVFNLYLIFAVLLLLCTKNFGNSVFNIVFSSMFFMIINFYLYYQGRYLIHRVDIGIILQSILLLGVNVSINEQKNNNILVFPIILFLILGGNYLINEDDINTLDDKNVKETLENIGEDQRHLYVYCKDERGGVLYYSDAYDVPAIGSLKNFVRGDAMDPETLSTYKAYGIDNPYLDVVDNNRMYLLMDKENHDEDKWETYISEHSGYNVELQKVKDYGTIKLYKVISKEIDQNIDFSDIEESNNIKYEIYSINEDEGVLNILGNAFVEGTSGYSENIYIKVKNQDMTKYYPTVQTISKNRKSNQEGYYSDFSVSIEGCSEEESLEMWIVIENSKGKLIETRLNSFK